ncbi:response regulator transcription factor [Thaumasiovibrio sp. DFM-14]|uniref:response regulator transcription factor n=1 Tax=Thaumasiovibrio sp. DFM-14 TaxID=3384792 RepID=UPI0039A1E484
MVYVIDDDIDLLKTLGRWLSLNNIKACCFDSAEAFIERVEPNSNPACIVLDLRMQGMSGLELQRKIKTTMAHWPIIFLTGHGKVSVAVDAVKKGAFDFLEKPVDNSVLLSTIQAALLDSQTRVALQLEDQKLTKRERQIVDWLAFGFSSKEIAGELNLSVKTVEYHRANINGKINLQSFKKNLMQVRQASGDS